MVVDVDGRDEADWRFGYVQNWVGWMMEGGGEIRSGRIQMALCLAREDR